MLVISSSCCEMYSRIAVGTRTAAGLRQWRIANGRLAASKRVGRADNRAWQGQDALSFAQAADDFGVCTVAYAGLDVNVTAFAICIHYLHDVPGTFRQQ